MPRTLFAPAYIIVAFFSMFKSGGKRGTKVTEWEADREVIMKGVGLCVSGEGVKWL